jgi:butyrate kinase
VTGLIKLCYSGRYTEKELKGMFLKQGGLLAYLGEEHLLTIRDRVLAGDTTADLTLRAMAYQMAKEAGGMAAALAGKVDALVITGGMANNDWLCGVLKQYLSFMAPVMVFPGEAELEALVRGVLRVLDGVEEEREYL